MIEHAIDERERTECRAILYAALALGFRRPNTETMLRLCTAEAARALADAAAPLDATGQHHLSELAGALADTQDQDNIVGVEEAFAALFGHTTRGVVPPYETEYGSDAPFLQPQEFSDIAGFFRAFGIVLNSEARERIDHVSCQCEFMAFLCKKEAHALANHDAEMREETRKGQRLFLRDHLGRFARTFGRRVARQDPLGFYGALGNLCIAFVQMECVAMDLPVGPDALQLRTPVSDDSPMACSTCTESVDADTNDSANAFGADQW